MVLQATPGITFLPTFEPATPNSPGVRGLVPAPPINTPNDYVLRADATWGEGGGGSNIVWVPYILITADSGNSGTKTFTNVTNLNLYNDDNTLCPLRVNGVCLDINDFTISGTTLDILIELASHARIWIESKAIEYGASMFDYRLLEDGQTIRIYEDGTENILE